MLKLGLKGSMTDRKVLMSMLLFFYLFVDIVYLVPHLSYLCSSLVLNSFVCPISL